MAVITQLCMQLRVVLHTLDLPLFATFGAINNPGGAVQLTVQAVSPPQVPLKTVPTPHWHNHPVMHAIAVIVKQTMATMPIIVGPLILIFSISFWFMFLWRCRQILQI